MVVAAFASWHEQHAAANRVLVAETRLVAHCSVETFSVLTRLPPPHRAAASLVSEFLAARFRRPYLVLPPEGHRDLIDRLTDLGIAGGAAYDALVAATAAANDALLFSCDRRAIQTYEALGAQYRLI